MILDRTDSRTKGFAALLLLLICARITAMIFIPLNEVTEARYGEIARKMLELNNWVTLYQEYNLPFLAKPPMSTWLGAGAMGLFGVSAFAVRLPSLLLSLVLTALIGHAVYRRHGLPLARQAVIMMLGSLGLFICSGTIMTDVTLVFSMTVIMISFWHAMHGGARYWRYLFFVGCGLGLLAKGPVALVLTGMPIFFWMLLRRQWLSLWRNLPWIGGSLLVLLIAAPWYYLAEVRTPGFLNYFLIGENIDRFLVSGWKGDRYGAAHAYPYGTIWLFCLMGLSPWIFFPIRWLSASKTSLRQLLADDDGWMLYLVLWSFLIVFFFTFCANIIWPYCLPPLPGFILLICELSARLNRRIEDKTLGLLACLVVLLSIGVTVTYAVFPQHIDRSDKDIITLWKEQSPAQDSQLIYWGCKRELSAEFYSAGKSACSTDIADVKRLFDNKTVDYLILPSRAAQQLPPDVMDRFKEAGRVTRARGTYILLEEKPASR